MKSAAAILLRDFISLFFPDYCLACHVALVKGEDLVCTKCILEIPRTNFHLNDDNPFLRKLRPRFPLTTFVSFFKFSKSSRVQNLLHALKYRNKPELAFLLGKVYGYELKAAGFDVRFELIIPIPMHPVKKKRRGYNQSEQFALGLGAAMGLPASDNYLEKTQMTDSQTRKSRVERWENMQGIFRVVNFEAIAGKRVLIADDVVTTGATLEAAAHELISGGVKEVGIVCIAATE